MKLDLLLLRGFMGTLLMELKAMGYEDAALPQY
jgi:hypothetical protein